MNIFKLLNKEKDDRISNDIQLVSIHIPKTAGTSFRNTLKEVYGNERVKRLDIGPRKFALEQEPFQLKKLPKSIKVVHGHMVYPLLKQNFNLAKEVPIITWLRDPVERVISNYYYLSKRLAEELDEEKKGLNILSKMQRSLMEYAHDEMNRNRISKFLEGLQPEDLFFIGLTEHYSEDLTSLAQLLNWQAFKEHQHNITGRKPNMVSEADKETIRKLNNLDMEWYHKALQLRNNRQSTG